MSAIGLKQNNYVPIDMTLAIPVIKTEYQSLASIQRLKWVIEYDDIHFNKEIGRGSSGCVYHSYWNGTEIAGFQILPKIINLFQ